MAEKEESRKKDQANAKRDYLERHTASDDGEMLTTNQGVKVNDDHNSLKAGERGPTLLEDFHMREKITHFDHERIPERIVHARGSAAHGYFELKESMSEFTSAHFLQTPGTRTPVFVRFSTVVGSRGSTDLARDVRGFATKFYTEEGVYDLVGNNMPVFFIQDAMKFPDLVHSIKPEPDSEMPQATAAHDTFWDFVSLTPETLNNVFWVISDRGIPRSYRMMEGFGIHTFRLVNKAGKSVFVKFHWKPVLGVHSVVWDEAQKISGMNPDFHRRDLWDAIESGNYPQYDFGVQIVPEEDEHNFNFDLLDPTKLIPEELVPVKIIGRMTLNRNPDNFFAETEQVAFHPGHVVPGIDFTNDPLLQGRLFSYTDTQLIRLGGPNFHEIPINRSVSPVHNNQRDGYMRQTINRGKSSYNPNSTGGGYPVQAKASEGGFVSYHERIDAHKVRARSKSFIDHFSQPAMFYHSQSEPEKKHMVDAFRFELGMVKDEAIRKRVVSLLYMIDQTLAEKVAKGLGFKAEAPNNITNHNVPADADPNDYQSPKKNPDVESSQPLSMANTRKDTIETRMVAVLAADGVDEDSLMKMRKALEDAGAMVKIVAPHLGNIKTAAGKELMVEKALVNSSSVLFDAVFIPAGIKSVMALKEEHKAIHFLDEAYTHCKAIAADGDGVDLWRESAAGKKEATADKDEKTAVMHGVILNQKPSEFVKAIAQHRFWDREKVPS
jgi:catalase